jgi:hypothetical protein
MIILLAVPIKQLTNRQAASTAAYSDYRYVLLMEVRIAARYASQLGVTSLRCLLTVCSSLFLLLSFEASMASAAASAEPYCSTSQQGEEREGKRQRVRQKALHEEQQQLQSRTAAHGKSREKQR